MNLLTVDQIVAQANARKETMRGVPVPFLNGTVLVWPISDKERARWEGSGWTQKGKKRVFNGEYLRAALLQLALRDEKGVQLFEEEQIPFLASLDACVTSAAVLKAIELAGGTEDDVELLRGNSSATNADASPSG